MNQVKSSLKQGLVPGKYDGKGSHTRNFKLVKRGFVLGQVYFTGTYDGKGS